MSLPPQLPIVPSAKPQVQVERPQAKPRTNDLEVRRATAMLAQRGRLRWGQNGSELHQPKITKWVQNLPESGARTHPRSQGKDLQRQAWRWALAQRASDCSLPSGREIADQFGRHERWGRMVKRSGTARELSSGHSELALRLVEQQSSPAAGE